MFYRLILILKTIFLKEKISIKKIYCFFINFFKGYVLKKDVLYSYPTILMLEPTNICNLNCKGCAYQLEGGRPVSVQRTAMPCSVYKKIIDEVKNHCLILFLYMGGESFLNKQIFEMINYASVNRIFTVIATNGSFVHIDDFGKKVIDSGLDVLIFSISGTTQGYYEKFHRGGSLESVMRNIESVRKCRKTATPRIILRYLATTENKGDWHNLKSFAKTLKVDGYEIRNIDGELVLSDNFVEVNQINTKVISMKYCFWLWSTMVIRSTGEVIPCCYDYYGVPIIGSFSEDFSIKEIWNNQKYRSFRRALLNNQSLECCIYCESKIGFQENASKDKKKIFVKSVKQKIEKNDKIFIKI